MAAYAAWEAKENAEFAAFMAASRDAWEWIMVSYCLRHGEAGDVTAVGVNDAPLKITHVVYL